ncbi:hypothetical protein J3R82DRAFT_6872 [Butyriboletus roseoflavus]|nr:hypothetical protein J3R82DRAFT_6872 [Butyriboletus roseoflavus]
MFLFLSNTSYPITTSDQFCSLVYLLSHLYFLGCFYTHYFVHFSLMTVPALMHSKPQIDVVNVMSLYQPISSAVKWAFQRLQSPAYDPGTQEAWMMCSVTGN